MDKAQRFKIAGLVAAATVGDGIFALPYVFAQAGWLLCFFYFVVLSILVILAHSVYLETLEKVGEKERLLGLAKIYLGDGGFWVGFFAIVAGLLLTLLAYLLLGTQFIHLALPFVRERYAFAAFWAFISIPLFLNNRRAADLEFVGIMATTLVVLLIFITAIPRIFFVGIPAIAAKNIFLPFGVVLFSLAGWTSIEPVYETRKKGGGDASGVTFRPWASLACGTGIAILLFIMFSAGILGSGAAITPDTASGLAAWPFWKKEILAIMGLVAIGTVCIPISREIKNSLEKDLHWNIFVSRGTILFLPPLLVVLGFNNFLTVVGLVGGLFLSVQYLLIVSIGRRALALGLIKKLFLDLAAVVFIIAAVYEVCQFVVH
jgi:amino acid permease